MGDAQRTYKDLLWQDAKRMSGAVCFYGTRIPVQDLFDWIDQGANIADFLNAFPQVGEERVHAVLQLAGSGFETLLEDAA